MIFDRGSKCLQKARVYWKRNGHLCENVNYVRNHIAKNIYDRIQVHIWLNLVHSRVISEDIDRIFVQGIDIGGGSGLITRSMTPNSKKPRLLLTEISGKLTVIVHTPIVVLDCWLKQFGSDCAIGNTYQVANEEKLPFPPSSFDLALSYSSNHLINDINGTRIHLISL